MLGIRDVASSRASKNWSLSSGAAQSVGAYMLKMVSGPVDVDDGCLSDIFDLLDVIGDARTHSPISYYSV